MMVMVVVEMSMKMMVMMTVVVFKFSMLLFWSDVPWKGTSSHILLSHVIFVRSNLY